MTSALQDGASLFGNVHEDTRCRLRIKGVDEGAVKVASFEATEGLSQLFSYRVVIATAPETVASLEDALGQEVALVVEREGKVERAVHGIVTEVAPDGAFVGKQQARSTILIEPRLANLRYSGGFRIFQNMTVKDIVDALLEPERIDAAWRLRPVPPVREYRTQLDESDLDFLSRLVADEGIHFYFELTEDKTTLVFTNNPLGFTDLEGKSSFDFRDTAGAVTGEHVRSIRRAQRVRIGALEHRDYDFRKPRLALLARSETADPQTEGNSKRREWRDYPGGFLDPDAEGTPRARMRLDELRSDAHTLQGTASTLRMAAGKMFTLGGHRDDAFNKKMLITRVGFTVTVEGAFFALTDGARGPRAAGAMALFLAVPSDLPVRPSRRHKPHSRLQTARVVGPSEGDPHVDEFGRITVQFMWDRNGKFDEHSSCSIRMMTPVAHDDEGFWSAHKVGSEVVVGFFDDDIDQPLVLGALYNGKERQPYKQPDDVTKSSWKVKSIPGGKGFNEFTFQNKAGKEEILLHAQRDHVEHVLRNHSETIGANQSTSVGANQSVSVGANQSISVGADRSVSVKGNESIVVKKARTESVEDNESVVIKNGRAHMITSGDDTLSVTGNRIVVISENDQLSTKTKADTIKETFALDAGTSVHIGQKKACCDMTDESVFVHSPKLVQLDCPSGFLLFKDNKVQLNATDELTLVCGASSISLKKDGTITITGGKEISAAVSSSSLKLAPDKGAISGPSVEVNAVGQCKVAGAIVKIN